jgi:hypothetical protein
LIHPRAHGREDLSVPEQAVLAVAQRVEGAQTNHTPQGAPQGLTELFFVGFNRRRFGLFLLGGWNLQNKLQNWPKETSALDNLKPRRENDYFV